jgi:hypothetical protein
VARFDSSKTGALDFSEYMNLLIEKMVGSPSPSCRKLTLSCRVKMIVQRIYSWLSANSTGSKRVRLHLMT